MLAAFDFFILSDTTECRDRRARKARAGRRAARAARRRRTRLFYRRRAENTGKKAGNIAEWIADARRPTTPS